MSAATAADSGGLGVGPSNGASVVVPSKPENGGFVLKPSQLKNDGSVSVDETQRHNTKLLVLLKRSELRALATDHGMLYSEDLVTDLAANLNTAASRFGLLALHPKVTAGPQTTWLEYQQRHSKQANGLVDLLQAYFEYGEEYALWEELGKNALPASTQDAMVKTTMGLNMDPNEASAADLQALKASDKVRSDQRAVFEFIRFYLEIQTRKNSLLDNNSFLV